MKRKLNDGIYIVTDGEEYRLEYVTPFDTETKCGQCDFMRNGMCKAPADCRKIEVEFTDAFWKKTEPANVGKNSDCNAHVAVTYVTPESTTYRYTIDNNNGSCEEGTVTVDNRFIGEFNI